MPRTVFDLTRPTKDIAQQVIKKYRVNALITAKRMAGISMSSGRPEKAKIWTRVVKILEKEAR